jgi:hypothetical protein
MKNITKKGTLLFILLSFLLNSCSKSEEEPQYIPPTITNFSETGLLGQPIIIEIENYEEGKIQVFFDLEEAQVYSVSETEIKVIVPRSIKRYNPTLKVIDLNENKTILDKTFFLKKPSISNYSSSEITFDETLTVYGENFDIQKEFISVEVNGEIAKVLSNDYTKIEIQIPTKITKANLEIKVKSQLQETTSSLPLVLKSPIIKGLQNDEVWLSHASFTVFGENFNPNQEFGEVYVNGIPCYFSVGDKKIDISTPPGPYNDFKITNITYKTAGLTASYDCNIKIQSNFIMVDHIDKAATAFTVFTHNNKAYTFKYTIPSTDEFNRNYTLLEFSPTTEKWTEMSTYNYSGYIVNAVYDGNNTVYLYKMSVSNQSFTLTKLNLDTFKETSIALPSNKIVSPIFFAYQEKLYLLSGLNIDSNVTVRDQKYEYSKASNTWTQLPSTAFSNLPLVSIHSAGGNPCNYLFNGGNIYISYGINFKTFKISPSLTVTAYPYELYFQYGNNIIGRYNNFFTYLYNITKNASKEIDIQSLAGYSTNFFTLNNEIYYLRNSYSLYYQNTIFTQKLNKEILNGLL